MDPILIKTAAEAGALAFALIVVLFFNNRRQMMIDKYNAERDAREAARQEKIDSANIERERRMGDVLNVSLGKTNEALHHMANGYEAVTETNRRVALVIEQCAVRANGQRKGTL